MRGPCTLLRIGTPVCEKVCQTRTPPSSPLHLPNPDPRQCCTSDTWTLCDDPRSPSQLPVRHLSRDWQPAVFLVLRASTMENNAVVGRLRPLNPPELSEPCTGVVPQNEQHSKIFREEVAELRVILFRFCPRCTHTGKPPTAPPLPKKHATHSSGGAMSIVGFIEGIDEPGALLDRLRPSARPSPRCPSSH